MLGHIINFAMVGAAVAVIGWVVYCYLTAPKVMTVAAFKPEDPPITRPATTMDKLAYSTKRSAALFTALMGGAGTFLINGVLNIADVFNAPEMKEWVMLHFTPEIASTIFVGFLMLISYARVRNAFK